MTEPIEYWNLVTGDPAQQTMWNNRHYFELAIYREGDRFQSHTFEGEFLGAYDSASTFKEAWFDALTYTTVGEDAYQAWESRPLPADPGTEPDSPVYSPVDWAKVPERMSPEELPRFLDD